MRYKREEKEMSWNKITDYLFEEYCVNYEDEKFCKLMKEHDKKIRDEAIVELVEKIKSILSKCPVGVDPKNKELLFVPQGDNVWHELLGEVVEELKKD